MAKALVSFAGDLELGLNGAVVKSDTWNDNPFSLELRRTSVKQSRNEVIAGIIRGEDIAAEMTFSTMQDLVRDSNADCICGGSDDERLPLTHAGLRQFLTVGYPQILTSVFGGGEVPAQLRVCPVLPNGPEAAVCLVATVSFACCAPVSHASLASEVETELRSFGAQLVFVLDGADNAHVLAAAAALRCPVAALQPSATTAGIFTLAYVSGGILTTPPPSTAVAAAPEAEQYSVAELEAAGYSADQIEAYQAQHSPLPTSLPPPPAAAAHVTSRSNGVAWTQRHETALVLHTSGTSGAKKRVPYTLQGLVVGAQCIAQSWALCSSDVCCNMMPLFHVGGIARNVFAPLLTGGSVVCLPAFDAGAFWHALEHQGVTWYYAGPTMHQQIIQAREEGSQAAAARLRMVANAAGGLLPVLAEEIKRAFTNAVVLPSYGMTECMPISTPPQTYQLDRPGTSGLPVGPTVRIFPTDGEPSACGGAAPTPLPPNAVGRIVLRGTPLFAGYEGNPAATQSAFFPGGWFDTGDLGYLDPDGFLYLTGRSKEVINRGGELISPFEVEEAYAHHPDLAQVLAVSVPHDTLQEVVGLVCVCKAGRPWPSDLAALQKFGAAALQPAKWPQLVAFAAGDKPDLPKGPTGKAARIGFASRAQLPALSDGTPPHLRLFEFTCPPKGSPANAPIACEPLRVDMAQTATVALAAAQAMQAQVQAEAQAPLEFSGPQGQAFASACAVRRVTARGAQVSVYLVGRSPNWTPEAGARLVATLKHTLPLHLAPSHVFVVLALPLVRCPAGLSSRAAARLGGSPPSGQGSRSGGGQLSAAKTASSGVLGTLRTFRTTSSGQQAKRPSGDDDGDADQAKVPFADVACTDLLASGFIVDVAQLPVPAKPRAKDAAAGHNVAVGANASDRAGEAGADKGSGSVAALEAMVVEVWSALLVLDAGELDLDDDFFEVGGTSLLAGRLVAAVRKQCGVALSAAVVFAAKTPRLMASLLAKKGARAPSRRPGGGGLRATFAADGQAGKWTGGGNFGGDFSGDVGGPSAPLVLSSGPADDSNPADAVECGLIPVLVQLFPLLLLYPARRIFTWTTFAVFWVYLQSKYKVEPLVALVVAVAVVGFAASCVLPFVGIAAKWLIVGQYRQGRYPVWGAMYLRWWLVDQILEICGRGVMVNYLPTYYRLLGARVGRHVKISAQATVKEFDLLTIGADAALDACLVRAFCVDRGTMLLLPVTVGAGCCVGPKSSVAPGTSLAPGTCLGPLTSSHEAGRDAHARHRKSCRPLFPGGPAGFAWRYWLVGKPCLGLVRGVGALPWLLVLWYAVTAVKTASGVSFVSTFQEAVAWFTLPQRVVLYCLLRAVQATLKPPLELAVAIALKRCVVGTLPAGPRPTHGSAAFNVWLANQLVGGGSLRGVTPLVGTHYEFVSCVYRLLGAKVGKRVYWPGSGLELAGLFDLLEVGDDVTFGSRSLVLAGDADTLATVAIGAGAMVADRCVLLPGTDVGRLATLGSGCLTRPRQRVPAGATVVGSRRGTCVELQGHDPDADKDTTPTVAPFGRAFYQGRAKGYRVRGQLEVALLGFSAHSTGAAFHALPLPAALAATVALDRYAFGGALIGAPWQFMLLLWPLYGVCFGGMVLSCLALDVACKWALLGRRTAGPHPWDTDPYCQNWQAYLTLASALRGSVGGGRGALDFVRGSALLNAYFRCLGATIESRVLLYPTGGDPMMTEPDLVTLERGACVDEASLVCHVNSRGAFALHPLVVGEGATLRSQSRLLSGAAMEPWSSLQEHTLVLGGDVVPEGVTWQGWPANQDDSSLLSRATLAAADGAPSAAAGRRSTAHQHGHEHRHGVRGSLAAVNRGGSSQGYRASQGQARLSTFNERFTVARPSGAAGRYSTATMAQLIRDSVV